MPAAAATTDLELEVHAPGGMVPAGGQGKLVVDGTVTGSQWPEHAPSQFKLRDGRTLLYDTYIANLVYLWDPDRRALTELGRYSLGPVGDAGLVITHVDAGNVTYLDVDPDRTAPRLRPVWSGPSLAVETTGAIDGEIAVLVRKSKDTVELVCVFGPALTSSRTYRMPTALRAVDADSIRDHRLLALGYEPPSSTEETPLANSIWMFDLDTGRARKISVAEGTYTPHPAIPHPYVRWGPPSRIPALTHAGDNIVLYVDPATEHVSPP